jgi:hypothetical protein
MLLDSGNQKHPRVFYFELIEAVFIWRSRCCKNKLRARELCAKFFLLTSRISGHWVHNRLLVPLDTLLAQTEAWIASWDRPEACRRIDRCFDAIKLQLKSSTWGLLEAWMWRVNRDEKQAAWTTIIDIVRVSHSRCWKKKKVMRAKYARFFSPFFFHFTLIPLREFQWFSAALLNPSCLSLKMTT